MSKKLCPKCKNYYLAEESSTGLCVLCSSDLPGDSSLPSYYNVHDLRCLLGLSSDEQVRRKARRGELPRNLPARRQYLWSKVAIDEWLEAGQPIPRIPTSPLQEEARAMCDKKDHTWLGDDKYSGVAFSSKDEFRITPLNTVALGRHHTCYFCGFSKYLPMV
jgi:hypothetical protein